MNDLRVPVTVLTGFLGSGKTTLLNRILSENHGKRIAVVENEYGEIGVDNDLVIDTDEEIFEMNNGCICCTVRGDLIRILGNLMKRKNKFDYIMIETTGLADPGPVIQTFFMDDEMQGQLRLDAVITLVDSKHIVQHIEKQPEVKEQVAFADVILLNKTDLVSTEEVDELESKIIKFNPEAKILRSQNANVPMDDILNVGGFDLDRALDRNAQFLEEEYPFEWSGLYKLKEGVYSYQVKPNHDHSHGHDHHHDHDYHHDHPLSLLVQDIDQDDSTTLKTVASQARIQFSEAQKLEQSAPIPLGKVIQVSPGCHGSQYQINISQAGSYLIFNEHHPGEHGGALLLDGIRIEPVSSQHYHHEHRHNDDIGSVGLSSDRPIQIEKFEFWLNNMLSEKGQDIFRTKGVIYVHNEKNRFVFQGVHMLLDGRPDREWGENEKKKSSFIFIGRNLNRSELEQGFAECLI